MAKDAKPAEEGVEAPPKKSKKLLIIILAVVLLLVLGGGAAAVLLLKGGSHGDEDEEVAEETVKPKKKDKKAEAPPVFVNMDPFTVNLVPETGDQYLQVVLSLELEDATAETAIKMQMPKIRNNITLLLSSKKASELLPKEGKQQLAAALMDEINGVVEPPVRNKKGETVKSEGPVKAVLFTSFIIQ
ncbi:flagellar basal body-associated protein FliL [Azonexus sp.]|uniref:flagellar basal body-associated protein FliL n=1 Tax=Azonexus sp. TaxID=1872668 RepID=UPI0035B1BAE9